MERLCGVVMSKAPGVNTSSLKRVLNQALGMTSMYIYIYILKDVCSLGRVDFRVDML